MCLYFHKKEISTLSTLRENILHPLYREESTFQECFANIELGLYKNVRIMRGVLISGSEIPLYFFAMANSLASDLESVYRIKLQTIQVREAQKPDNMHVLSECDNWKDYFLHT